MQRRQAFTGKANKKAMKEEASREGEEQRKKRGREGGRISDDGDDG
jgi:hypothetical protein